MPSVVHVVTTRYFAGVERYVSETARETASRGWEVAVVGGDPARMSAAVGDAVRWLPGATAAEALASLARLGPRDVCHAHLTIAEAVAVAGRPLHRAPVVSTRHMAAPRGSSHAGRLLAPWIGRNLARQIAVSDFVAQRVERRPDAVVPNGVAPSPSLWNASSRVVLVLQRLEPEKHTLTALRAWRSSGLASDGWQLRVVGDGAERGSLEAWVRSERVAAVEFSGWTADVGSEFAGAGMLLAPAPAEPFGLVVVEAMAAGVPVVACAGGGHLETVGRLAGPVTFPPGDAKAAADALRSLLPENTRAALSRRGRALVSRELTLARHVDRLLAEYRQIPGVGASELEEVVVCSLEAWDDVWRRNQFFVAELLRRDPHLRVLFVEPPADPIHDAKTRRRPRLVRLRSIDGDGRLRAFRPVKVLPRRAGPLPDRLLLDQVRLAALALGFSRPVLWLNDLTYAPLIERTGWPCVYDVTDDWLRAPFPPRELDRLQRLERIALEQASEVVVCSPALAESRGAVRPVTLVPNAVDLEHFRRPRQRPADLPPSPVAVYVGTLHEARLDIELVANLAQALPSVHVALVGPIALERSSRQRLLAHANVRLLGPRPYRDVPAYLQHADVIVVPHLVTPFTDSLDPIKAYECSVLPVPTVATAVAAFRDLAGMITVASSDTFAAVVASKLAAPAPAEGDESPPSWDVRTQEFERVLIRARARCLR